MTWLNMNFQDAMSPTMYYMIFFHEFIMFYIIFISMMIIFNINNLNLNKNYSNLIINHQLIETIWTMFPMIILILLAIPSIKILYLTDEIKLPNFSIKTIGNQWYWTYEFPHFNHYSIDSYLNNEFKNKNFRLLDVDNRFIIPMQMKIRLLTTSNDVIHSFTIPSLGFKMDSIPGRINQNSFMINNMGIFYGQCSEICGMNHSFMPIVLETNEFNMFKKWMIHSINNNNY